MTSQSELSAPERLLRPFGADCGQCEMFKIFLMGNMSGLVNSQTGYGCCWLPVV